MHRFLLETEGSENFLWVIRESNSIFEIVIIQIVIHVVHEESKLRNEFSVFILINVQLVSNRKISLAVLIVDF